MILSKSNSKSSGLSGSLSYQTAYVHLQVTLYCILLCHGIVVRAQTVSDTIRTVKIHPDLKNMIRFSGFAHPKSIELLPKDTLRFTGEPSVGHFKISEFLKKAIIYEDKYRKQLEAIYKPLREEQQRIIRNGGGKGSIRYNAKLGYPNPFDMPVELLNENKHPSDAYNETKNAASDILKKYEYPVK